MVATLDSTGLRNLPTVRRRLARTASPGTWTRGCKGGTESLVGEKAGKAGVPEPAGDRATATSHQGANQGAEDFIRFAHLEE